MVELRLGDQVFSYDREETKAAYASLERGDADTCGCDGCRNFAAQRTTIYPPKFRLLLEHLGIDPLKEGEAVHYGAVPPDPHPYDGWFYFVGSMVTAGTHAAEEDGFFYWISSSFAPPPPSFGGKEVLTLEFRTRLPWVLATPPEVHG